MADDNVVPLRVTDNTAKRIELWQGVIRFMEGNGLTKIEVSIDRVREICRLYEEASRAQGR